MDIEWFWSMIFDKEFPYASRRFITTGKVISRLPFTYFYKFRSLISTLIFNTYLNFKVYSV